MRFEEALTLLRKGAKIRHEKGNDDQYLELDSDGDIVDENGQMVLGVTCPALLSDWIVHEEEESEDCEDCVTLADKLNDLCEKLAEYEARFKKLESKCNSKKS